ncbi:MAG TPA: bifunctional hydroxymethylpyrimidine kinase/phosphomethylpyrimidine kinase [Chloroflexia bacterium]|nr:bifunctional hydroxymethylpyrimidine kinase/phosphomethylpyrimidine kinase [Chloroflexia bacterium]
MPGNKIYKALTIAGSDSGGGAGIQADLKTFSALGAYGSSVITALTAQNTVGVQAVFQVLPEFVAQQLDSVLSDIGTDAAKTGMLFNAAIISTVSEKVKQYRLEKLVVDPVMVAKSGDRLLLPEAVKALQEQLLPLSYLVTPNIPEAEVLAGITINSEEQIREGARRIHALGVRHVLIKGGHLSGERSPDLLFDGKSFAIFDGLRVPTQHSHGTGCTLSAAITALLARGFSISEAIAEAKAYLTGALQAALPIGSGHSPVAHFHHLQAVIEEQLNSGAFVGKE